MGASCCDKSPKQASIHTQSTNDILSPDDHGVVESCCGEAQRCDDRSSGSTCCGSDINRNGRSRYHCYLPVNLSMKNASLSSASRRRHRDHHSHGARHAMWSRFRSAFDNTTKKVLSEQRGRFQQWMWNTKRASQCEMCFTQEHYQDRNPRSRAWFRR